VAGARACATHDVRVTVNGPIDGGKRRVRNHTRLPAIRTVSFPNDHTAPPLRDGLKCLFDCRAPLVNVRLTCFGSLYVKTTQRNMSTLTVTAFVLFCYDCDSVPQVVMNMTNFGAIYP